MEHAVDVKIILLNNSYLGMVRQWQELFGSAIHPRDEEPRLC